MVGVVWLKDVYEREEGSRCRAERAISRLLWDPTYDAVRADLLVEWNSQQDSCSRRSGAAAWSARVQTVRCGTLDGGETALSLVQTADSAERHHIPL